MRVWYFSEMAYHPAWEEGLKRGSLRVVLPNAQYDPKIGHQLLNRYLDEFRLCDEVGLDIMVNEHHSTATCLSSSCTLQLAILARETKKVRLLCLGVPLANRPDPVRVAQIRRHRFHRLASPQHGGVAQRERQPPSRAQTPRIASGHVSGRFGGGQAGHRSRHAQARVGGRVLELDELHRPFHITEATQAELEVGAPVAAAR